jgi:triacylglycerol lipase
MENYEQALLMAKFSALAYNDNQSFKEYGYDSIFLTKDGTQAYFLWDINNIIIICRGTEPSEWSDIKADVKLELVPSLDSYGEVHKGFRQSVDNIWLDLLILFKKYGKNRKVWCTGHSLGAAMATLIATRCHQINGLPNPILYTFGSPKVGNKVYIDHMNSLNIEHYRFVNNADIVTRNPLYPYHHHGKLYYFDHNGKLANMSKWQTAKDRVKGFFVGIKKGKINFFVNHFMDNYISNLELLK